MKVYLEFHDDPPGGTIWFEHVQQDDGCLWWGHHCRFDGYDGYGLPKYRHYGKWHLEPWPTARAQATEPTAPPGNWTDQPEPSDEGFLRVPLSIRTSIQI